MALYVFLLKLLIFSVTDIKGGGVGAGVVPLNFVLYMTNLTNDPW